MYEKIFKYEKTDWDKMLKLGPVFAPPPSKTRHLHWTTGMLSKNTCKWLKIGLEWGQKVPKIFFS